MTTAENIDCMEGMKRYPDKYFDLAIVDPPYGIGESRRTQSRPLTAKQKNGTRLRVSSARKHKVSNWDDNRPDKSYFKELFRVSKNQIIWGGNHFADMLPASSGWIVWDKCNSESDQSDCELAWTSYKCGVRQIEYMWNGFIQGLSFREGRIAKGDKRTNEVRIHPTQKPVELYKWVYYDFLSNKPEVKTVLDTHRGSGSHDIVADMVGVDLTSMEIDKDYFEGAEKRFREYKSQLTMFAK